MPTSVFLQSGQARKNSSVYSYPSDLIFLPRPYVPKSKIQSMKKLGTNPTSRVRKKVCLENKTENQCFMTNLH